jgi:hypothetical protein
LRRDPNLVVVPHCLCGLTCDLSAMHRGCNGVYQSGAPP